MSLMPDANVNYNDFSSLSRLRVDAREDSQAALEKVAKQFESVFVQMMIKSMREASVPLQGELFHSQQSKAYTDMYDKQLGLELTKTNGIGLADVIVRQLSKPGSSVDNQQPEYNLTLLQMKQREAGQTASLTINELPEFDKQVPVITKAIDDNYQVEINTVEQSPHWRSPQDFIRDSWPHAVRAGEQLGVDPRAILAQTALETGWGKKVHSTDTGESSYSLFGIKANNGWQGKTVNFNTLEFRSGSMNRETANFRAYDSLSEAYQDYVHFLNNNPRYQNVLQAETAVDFSRQLQKAGYATDPNYSEKIERIRTGNLLNNILSELKISQKEPLV